MLHAQLRYRDLHSAVYDFGLNQMYVGLAGFPILENGKTILNGTIWGAYQRPWFQFNMNALFSQSWAAAGGAQ